MVERSNVISMGRDHTLRDIPAMMRELADKLEQGDETAQTMLVLIPRDTTVDVFLWGDDLGHFGVIGVLDSGKALLLNNDVERT